MSQNYYETLNVTSDSSIDTIKKNYRKLAMDYHPDRNPNNPQAEEKFKKLVEAYETLSNPTKRENYDLRNVNVNTTSKSSPFTYSNYTYQQTKKTWQQQRDDINEANEAKRRAEINRKLNEERRRRYEFLDAQEDEVIKNYYNSTRVNSKMPSIIKEDINKKYLVKEGSNIKIGVELTKEELLNGINKTIKLKKYYKCEECFGRGTTTSEQNFTICNKCFGVGCDDCKFEGTILINQCEDCQGWGRIEKELFESISIPQNSKVGDQYLYKNLGDAGIHNEKHGDLIIEINGISNNLFDVFGKDIMLEKTITLNEAIFGGIFNIPNVNSSINVKIAPGIKTGDIFKIDGMGILKENQQGDYYIKFKVKITKNDIKNILNENKKDGFNLKKISAKIHNLNKLI